MALYKFLSTLHKIDLCPRTIRKLGLAGVSSMKDILNYSDYMRDKYGQNDRKQESNKEVRNNN